MNVRQLVLQTLNLGASDPHRSPCLEPRAPQQWAVSGRLPDRRPHNYLRSDYLEEPDPVDWQRVSGADPLLPSHTCCHKAAT